MKSMYRILKLKSGEELITKIVGQKKGKYILERPMVFKSSLIMDNRGRQREITVLKNWLQFTEDIVTEIPKDFVATFLVPDPTSSELYDLEKEREDAEPTESRITGGNMSEEEFDFPLKDIAEDIMKSLGALGSMSDMDNNKEYDKYKEEEGDMVDYENIEELEMIWDSIISDLWHSTLFPPPSLVDLIERGMVDPNEIKRILNDIQRKNRSSKKISDTYTGDESDRKDFGNQWTDWPIDPNDYLN